VNYAATFGASGGDDAATGGMAVNSATGSVFVAFRYTAAFVAGSVTFTHPANPSQKIGIIELSSVGLC
jgi:hypothetical protein